MSTASIKGIDRKGSQRSNCPETGPMASDRRRAGYLLSELNDLDSGDLREVCIPREHGYALNRCRGRNERIEWPRAHASTAGCRDHLGVRASDSVVHGECLEAPLDLGEHREPPGALLESRRDQHAKRELSK